MKAEGERERDVDGGPDRKGGEFRKAPLYSCDVQDEELKQ